MKILLDTQISLWALTEPKRLGKQAQSMLKNRNNQLYLSAASSWEISIKAGLGKLPLPETPDIHIPSRMMELTILPLNIEHHHTFKVFSLPLHHRDPFDRILIAQAIAENFYLISADEQFRSYSLNLLWGFD
ncbi:type II toxin-antitoxin system VapC family toxin [Myxosarcina sp. GI1]|uniref:type II toxin-antitoxin system VapC family toxin n=1 Tax=Myxosarcina sp. GI1 TaxID=1541065 RepID=UPI00056BA778|nr:type II toxin-antitoxin system VapC family toxin [Myxosarcina sp. GI1]